MKTRIQTSAILAALVLAGALGDSATASPADSSATQPPPLEVAPEANWSFSASVYAYLVPEGRDFAQPTFAADHDWLHLEARYNYEGLDTGSAWIGYNFSGGQALSWELTPMVGGVFGRTDGVAPGYKGSLSWWKLELYSEGEFVYDWSHSSESFFYTWTELTVSPVEWFRFGLVVQRTRDYESDLDVQRGFLVGFQDKHVSFTTSVFNPDESKPVVVVAVGVSF